MFTMFEEKVRAVLGARVLLDDNDPRIEQKWAELIVLRMNSIIQARQKILWWIHTAIGEIAITHEQVFVEHIRGITGRLGKFNPKEAEDELTLDEIKDLLHE